MNGIWLQLTGGNKELDPGRMGPELYEEIREAQTDVQTVAPPRETL